MLSPSSVSRRSVISMHLVMLAMTPLMPPVATTFASGAFISFKGVYKVFKLTDIAIEQAGLHTGDGIAADNGFRQLKVYF